MDDSTILTIISCLCSALASGGIFTLVQWLIQRRDNKNDAMLCLLRTEILKMYYHNKSNKSLRQYQRQNLDLLFQAYTDRHGNSFISDIYSEMRDWMIED